MTKNTKRGTGVPRLKFIICGAPALVFAAALVLAGCKATPVDEFDAGPGESVAAAGITIVKQPQSPDKAYFENDASIAPLVVEATLTGENGEDEQSILQYQWYSQKGNDDPQEIPESEGGTNPSFTPPDDSPGMTQYLVEVSAKGDVDAAGMQIIPVFSNPASVWVVSDEDPVIVSISGGSLNSGAYLSNGATNAQIPLKNTDPGWSAYELDPGVWTLQNYAPEGKTVSMAPSSGSIEVKTGEPQLLAVTVTDSSANGGGSGGSGGSGATGTISLNVIGTVGVLPGSAMLVGPDNTQISAAGGSKTYYELTPGVWELSNLPSDGSVTTSPNPPVVYLVAGSTKVIGAIVNIADMDSDDDGYPDFWERAHQSEGFSVTMPDKPYGIDLSRDGAVPPGVTWSLDTSTYTVQPSYDGSNTEYRVYHSTPGKNVAAKVDLAPGAKTTLLLDNATLSGGITVNDKDDLTLYSDGTNSLGVNVAANATASITLENIVIPGVITVNNGARLTLRSTAGEDQPNLRIPNGAAATVILDGVQFAGADPIDVLPGGKLTLLLDGTNTVTANSSAGIHVPSGAGLAIDSTTSGSTTSGTLTVQGNRGAGIGGANTEDAGTIIIAGGNITAKSTSGACIGGGENGGEGGHIEITGGTVTANEPSSSSAAIGSGGHPRNMNNNGYIKISGGVVYATSGLVFPSGTAIGGGTDGNGGTIIITGNPFIYAVGAPPQIDDPTAIGGANYGHCGDLTIDGGTIVAISRNPQSAASIGNSSNLNHSTVNGSLTIKGGTIIASGFLGGVGCAASISGNPVILAGYLEGFSSTPDKGILLTYDVVSGSGDPCPASTGTITLPGNFTVPTGAVFTVPPGWTLDIGNNTLTNNGTILGNWNGSGKITGAQPKSGDYGNIIGQ